MDDKRLIYLIKHLKEAVPGAAGHGVPDPNNNESLFEILGRWFGSISSGKTEAPPSDSIFAGPAEWFKQKFPNIGDDLTKTGTSFFGWIKEQLTALGGWLGRIATSLLGAIGSAASQAHKFLSAMFESKDGAWQYMQQNQLFGITASSWIVVGVIAMFSMWVILKLVKWLRSRRTEDVLINDLNKYSMLMESMMITENMQVNFAKKAAGHAYELSNEISTTSEDESTLWKTIKMVAKVLLFAFGVYLLIQYFKAPAAIGSGDMATRTQNAINNGIVTGTEAGAAANIANAAITGQGSPTALSLASKITPVNRGMVVNNPLGRNFDAFGNPLQSR